MYTHGRFMLMYGKTNIVLQSKIKKKKISLVTMMLNLVAAGIHLLYKFGTQARSG